MPSTYQPIGTPPQPMNQAAPQQFGAQPQQFGAQGYGAPVYATQVAVRKKPVGAVVAGVCLIVLAVFLVLLFTVILPNAGAGAKLKHKWKLVDDSVDAVLDLERKEAYIDGDRYTADWQVDDDDITITLKDDSGGEAMLYGRYTLSSNDRVLTIKYYGGESETFRRSD